MGSFLRIVLIAVTCLWIMREFKISLEIYKEKKDKISIVRMGLCCVLVLCGIIMLL